MKGCSLFNAKYYLCNRNSERSLVIQNNELSRISLISKSLPIQPVFNRRVLCFKHLAQYHIFLADSNKSLTKKENRMAQRAMRFCLFMPIGLYLYLLNFLKYILY